MMLIIYADLNFKRIKRSAIYLIIHLFIFNLAINRMQICMRIIILFLFIFFGGGGHLF